MSRFILLFLINVIFSFYISTHSFSSDFKYEEHQYVSNSFFRKVPVKKETKDILEEFNKDYKRILAASPYIILDGLSSRSRILIFRSIAETVYKRYETEKNEERLYDKKTSYFSDYKGTASSKRPINFKFGLYKFSIRFNPIDRQPGNGVLAPFEKCEELYTKFSTGNLNVLSKKVAQSLQAERTKTLESTKMTIFFEFEIARRLVGSEPLNDYDRVPIASAIIYFLELSAEGKVHFREFFKKPEKDYDFDKGCIETYAGFNPFDSLAWMREAAIKNILSQGFSTRKKTNAQARIKQDYYDFFGGESESEDDTEQTNNVGTSGSLNEKTNNIKNNETEGITTSSSDSDSTSLSEDEKNKSKKTKSGGKSTREKSGDKNEDKQNKPKKSDNSKQATKGRHTSSSTSDSTSISEAKDEQEESKEMKLDSKARRNKSKDKNKVKKELGHEKIKQKSKGKDKVTDSRKGNKALKKKSSKRSS